MTAEKLFIYGLSEATKEKYEDKIIANKLFFVDNLIGWKFFIYEHFFIIMLNVLI